MALPIYKSDDQTVTLLQTGWSAQINPAIDNALVKGVLQKSIDLKTGNNVINHKLGRALQGWIITGMHNSFSQIYDTVSNTPNLTLNLNSSASTTIDIYCF